MGKKTWLSVMLVCGATFIAGILFIMRIHESGSPATFLVKRIIVTDNDFTTEYRDIDPQTVGEFISEHLVELQEHDSIYPALDTPLSTGLHIFVVRAREIRVVVDGKELTFFAQARSIEEALYISGVTLGEDDIVVPERASPVSNTLRVVVTRVKIQEEARQIPIVFETKITEDDSLSWRKKIIVQKGETGIQTITYRIAYHDEAEVSRKILKTEITKEPVVERVTQGTYVKVGKSHRGAASWYAYTGTLSAANPWLPMGSYVKVTNLDNGQSVVVKINDRGPFAPGRIIDLDKVAFAKIASIGAGVIHVKMEEVTN